MSALREAGLSKAEVVVIERIVQGGTRKEVGLALNLSWRTVRSHLGSVYKKLGVKNRVQLALKVAEIRKAYHESR